MHILRIEQKKIFFFSQKREKGSFSYKKQFKGRWYNLKTRWNLVRWRRSNAKCPAVLLPLRTRGLRVPVLVLNLFYCRCWTSSISSANLPPWVYYSQLFLGPAPPSRSPSSLFPHQLSVVQQISNVWRTTNVCALHLPFGSGKTRVAFTAFTHESEVLYITLPSLVPQVKSQLLDHVRHDATVTTTWVVEHRPTQLSTYRCVVLDEYPSFLHRSSFKRLLKSAIPNSRWLLLTGEPDSGPLVRFRSRVAELVKSPAPSAIVQLDRTSLPLREPVQKVIWLDMNTTQQAQYRSMLNEAAEATVQRFHILQRHRAEVSRWKIPRVVALLLAAPVGTRRTVFSEFNSTLVELAVTLRTLGYSTTNCFSGTVHSRTAAVANFLADPSQRTVLLASVSTSAKGLNLGSVGLLILADSFYQQQATRQATARIVRIDSTATDQTVLQLIHRGTFEAALWRSNTVVLE